MSCSCHKPNGGRSVEGRVEPSSQCTTCALKHIEMAMEAWGEFLYEEDNRRWCARHLRLAIEHLKIDHRELAIKCREIANIIELALDKDIREVHDKIHLLYDEALELFRKDNPEYVGRLEKLKIFSELKVDTFSKEENGLLKDVPIEPVETPADDILPLQSSSEMTLEFMPPMEKDISSDELKTTPLISTPEDDSLVDVIIPLGLGSNSKDDELKILLRSLARHAGKLGRILIATTHVPDWLNRDNVTIVPLEDREAHCKDANLIYKTLETIKQCGVRRFVWCADDNVLMQDIPLDEIPRLYNPRGRSAFSSDGTWSSRVRNTFDYFKHNYGIEIDYNFESHAPQYFDDAQKLVESMKSIDYRELPGLTIMTCFRCAMEDVEKGSRQEDYKETFETADSVKGAKFNKMFVGYNDRAFIAGGLKEKLFAVFHKKSRYEK